MRDLWKKATRNPGFKILSFVLACLAWWYVQQEQVHETRVRANVQWLVAEGLTSPDLLPNQVTLSLRGTGISLKRAKEARIHLPVDVRDAGMGQHEISFMAFDPVGLPDGVEVLGCSPTAMRFTLDESDQRKVKITPVLVGEPAAGYLIEAVSLAKPVIEVVGPRTLVSSLREVPTAPIDVSGLDADVLLPVELALPRGVMAAGPEVSLEAQVTVVPELERRVISGVPISVWAQNGWTSRPTVVEVTLEGASKALEQIQPIDVAAFVHLPDQPESPFYKVPYGPTEGVRIRISVAGQQVTVAKVEPARIEVWRQ